ncbi:hypothetical protein HGRIS_014916 [Hohenbuehelia grisea]|uniref:Uncharacterized protein n=1 Tax=Hohenbuehelia grisea TaxID=104357 RepID=A0ABR3JM77_9AGAR
MSLDLASSTLTFVDAAINMKNSFSNVQGSKRRLHNTMAGVVRSLGNLEGSVRQRYSLLDESECRNFEETLKEIRGAVVDTQSRLNYSGTEASGGLLSSVVSGVKAWFRCSATEAKIQQLEGSIRSCQLRFLTLTFVQSEYNVIVSHHEDMEHLAHLEDLLSSLLVCDGRIDLDHPSLAVGFEPNEIDFQFLHRQITRIAGAFERRQQSWAAKMEVQRVPQDFPESFTTNFTHFSKTLQFSFSALQQLSDESLVIPPNNFLNHLFALVMDLLVLGRDSNADLVFTIAYTFVRLLGDTGHTSRPYRRTSAFFQYHATILGVKTKNPLALTRGEDTVAAWQGVYDEHGDSTDLFHLIEAITLYDMLLFQNGHLEQSLDCSQQVLLLLRAAPTMNVGSTTVVAWSASGEADVVYSSNREMSQPGCMALAECNCLWNLAKSLAFAGQYAKARVAAMDAVSCREACLASLEHPASDNEIIKRWRMEIPTWVSIIRNPTDHSHSPASSLVTA